VNEWLLTASWWQRALAMGVPSAAAIALVLRLGEGAHWESAVLGGLVAGLVIGPALGAMVGRQNRSRLAAVGDAPDDVRSRVAARSTLSGPVPADPAERAATARLIDSQLAEMRRRRLFSLVSLTGVLGWTTYLAIAGSPWLWAAVAAVAGLLVLVLLVPGRLERRARLLREGAPPA